MRSAEPCRVDVDARHFERVGRQVGRVDRDLRVGHRRQHRQAAVAGAQVEHARGVFADSQGSMLPSASSSAMKLRGTMARSST